jgi:hypothetical protein
MAAPTQMLNDSRTNDRHDGGERGQRGEDRESQAKHRCAMIADPRARDRDDAPHGGQTHLSVREELN